MNKTDLTNIVEKQFNILMKKKKISAQQIAEALTNVAKESYKLGEVETKIDTIFDVVEPVSERSV